MWLASFAPSSDIQRVGCVDREVRKEKGRRRERKGRRREGKEKC